MKAIIDRIEDGIATLELENGKVCEIPAEYLDGFSQGDAIDVTFAKDEKRTAERKERVKQKLSQLFDN